MKTDISDNKAGVKTNLDSIALVNSDSIVPMKKDISDNQVEISNIKASAKTNLDSITPMIKDISDNKVEI